MNSGILDCGLEFIDRSQNGTLHGLDAGITAIGAATVVSLFMLLCDVAGDTHLDLVRVEHDDVIIMKQNVLDVAHIGPAVTNDANLRIVDIIAAFLESFLQVVDSGVANKRHLVGADGFDQKGHGVGSHDLPPYGLCEIG